MLGDRLDGADLVVGVHHRHERGVVGDRVAHAIDRDDAAGVDRHDVTRQPRRASAFIVLSTASCSIALVTRCLRPDGSSASAAPRIARLSLSVPPAGEDDFGRVGADQGCRPTPAPRPARLWPVDRNGERWTRCPRRRAAPGPSGRRPGGRAGSSRYGPDRYAWGEMPIVAFLLTLSNKRGRQRFTGASILAGLQTEAHSPGFRYWHLLRVFQ